MDARGGRKVSESDRVSSSYRRSRVEAEPSVPFQCRNDPRPPLLGTPPPFPRSDGPSNPTLPHLSYSSYASGRQALRLPSPTGNRRWASRRRSAMSRAHLAHRGRTSSLGRQHGIVRRRSQGHRKRRKEDNGSCSAIGVFCVAAIRLDRPSLVESPTLHLAPPRHLPPSPSRLSLSI